MATFEPGNVAPAPAAVDAHWFLFVGGDLVIREAPKGAELPVPVAVPENTHYLGTLDGAPCWTARIPLESLPPGTRPENLRNVFPLLADPLWWIAGRGIQILEWDRTHQFCGSCGRRTHAVPNERARRCDDCDLSVYPRISPAIIVLVRRGKEALLARANSFVREFYSTLAGFVEPGESLEQALAREVKEEVGIEVKNIRYFGSQPWPFPNSLMLGFTADWAGGEIVVDPHELMDAKWFKADALPKIPPRMSIARRLIDHWLEDVGASKP